HRHHLVGGRDIRRVRRTDRSQERRPAAHRLPGPEPAPAIVGVFTDLTGPAADGMSFSATIDTRFSTTPTTLKLVAIIL
ncbi:hypothetical protein H7H37_12280, partial [Mycolicibacterium insubricum]|nr:hypothetical protein [Mycolicibacterium insubricum]